MAEKHLFPWWAGWFLLNPLRKFYTDPQKLFKPYVKEGMTVLDLGCAMGFFSLPLAEMTGPSGKVICIDLQKQMLNVLSKRSARSGLSGIIEARLCTAESLNIDDLKGRAGFALAFGVVHETLNEKKFITEVYDALQSGGLFFMAEPSGHVTEEKFNENIDIALNTGFSVKENRNHRYYRGVILEKQQGESGPNAGN